MALHNGHGHGDQFFYEQLYDRIDAHLRGGGDPDVLASALGVMTAEVMARVIHYGKMPRGKADAWIAHHQAMLPTAVWRMVDELKAQPPERP
jgi:hypothetical protein